MPLSTLVAGFIFVVIIGATWFFCFMVIQLVMWCYHSHQWNKNKREFYKKFYHKGDI